jgi:hypothetical protein
VHSLANFSTCSCQGQTVPNTSGPTFELSSNSFAWISVLQLLSLPCLGPAFQLSTRASRLRYGVDCRRSSS